MLQHAGEEGEHISGLEVAVTINRLMYQYVQLSLLSMGVRYSQIVALFFLKLSALVADFMDQSVAVDFVTLCKVHRQSAGLETGMLEMIILILHRSDAVSTQVLLGGLR